MTEHGVEASRTTEAAPERRCREWYEAHGHAVYGYLRFHLSSADEAEELTAEVFLRAVRAAHRFDAERGSPRTWLLGIARNALHDHRRRERRRRQVPMDALLDLRSDAPSPEERLLWQETVARLLAAVAELGDGDREIIGLRYGSGLVTLERCCLDFDGGGPADDGLLVIGVPPDRVVMAAIYERGDGGPDAGRVPLR